MAAVPNTQLGGEVHPLELGGSTVRIGVSGWRYAPWRGVFYPHGLRQADELGFISRTFCSVELNGSFYSLQRPSLYATWRDATPDSFVFSVKGGRYVTHLKRLRDVDTALANFFASGVMCLGRKLGPILWQLPARVTFEPNVIERFLALLPRDTAGMAKLAANHDERVAGRSVVEPLVQAPVLHTLEVRHPSFIDSRFYALLREHSVACCVADSGDEFPMLDEVTAPFVYARLHGSEELYMSGYRPAQLRSWSNRVRKWADQGCDVYLYFDNDGKVRAPFDAANLIRTLQGKPMRRHRTKEPRATP